MKYADQFMFWWGNAKICVIMVTVILQTLRPNAAPASPYETSTCKYQNYPYRVITPVMCSQLITYIPLECTWQCFGSEITLRSRYVSVSVCVRMCTYLYVLCMFVYVSVCMCTYYICKKELSFISNRQRQITVVSLLWVRTGKVPDVDTHTTSWYTYRLSLHWVTA